jgi:outer membrane protein assembly factor BamB
VGRGADGPSYTTVAVAHGRVYGVGDQDGFFYALDATTGAMAWVSSVGMTAISGHTPAVVVGDVVAVTGSTGAVWAFAA